MIIYRETTSSELSLYDRIPMLVRVKSILIPEKLENGFGGVIFHEKPVPQYTKDLGKYVESSRDAERFDTSNWIYFMAFDGENAVGGCTVASRTLDVHMLENRDDLTVLWDLRVRESHQGQGIGRKLFQLAAEWSRTNGFRQMKIECQNNNVKACRLYSGQGAILGAFSEYAYYNEPEIRDEIQLLWYLNL